MKARHIALGAFAGLVCAQDPEVTTTEAIDQCTQSAFDACPADVTTAHRCLKIKRPSDGVLVDQCVFSCAADSACRLACTDAPGGAWCNASGGCLCDMGWDSAQAAPSSPEDLSWVKKWAAVGDSYSAGIGSGNRYPDSPKACSRSDQSYPAYIHTHELMPQNPPAAFEFLSCSGATSPEVLGNQVAGMGTGYDVITVSAGGNDVGLRDVLNACIFQWNPTANCDDALQKTGDLIRDVLPGNLDQLYAGLKGKINPGRKVYVTGYATFFDNSTELCDNVSWSFWYNVKNKQYLTTERRTILNELVLATNAAIQAAAQRAGEAFEYVGYDEYFSAMHGRFCEANVTEPDGNRDGLLFFERGTKRHDPTLLGRRDIAAPELSGAIPRSAIGLPELPDLEARGSPPGIVDASRKRSGHVGGLLRRGRRAREVALQDRQAADDNGTAASFGNYIEKAIAEARTRNSSLVASLPETGAADPALLGRAALKLSNLVGDEHKRVFHPRPAGHAVIANLVLWRMTGGAAEAQNSPTSATEAVHAEAGRRDAQMPDGGEA
ncbi:SGNH hydrolase [Colletotrichum falcatum]|nr:SGNH hydrolase [Colletotrichum falcatum]